MMKTGRVTPEAIEKMLGKADKDSDGYKNTYLDLNMLKFSK